MANAIEQEIKVKLKAVLEGFDALKQVKDDIKSIFSEGGKGKLFGGAKGEAKEIVNSVNNLNNTVSRLPEQFSKANQQSRGLLSSLFEIAQVAGAIGQAISAAVGLLKFFGVTGKQVIETLKSVFTKVADFFGGAFNAVTDVFGSVIQGVTGAAQKGGTAIAGMGSTAASALPALGSLAAGIGAVGAVVGAVVLPILALVAAVGALVAAIGGIALAGTAGTAAMLALAKGGFEYLAALEQIELGTGALIAQLSEIKANGLVLNGADKVNAGIELAKEQMKKLRVDAINTTATFEQLGEVFQAAVGSGLGAGLTLDEIRQIAVQLSQAGAALGVPMEQMRQEVNSILEGTIDINSRIAKNLGISNEQVKKWKEQNILAEELNKKLASFNIAGVKAAATFNGLKSNLQEALNVLQGEATIKAFETLKNRLSKILNSVFDFKSGGLNKAFKPIADLIDKTLVQGIERFAGWIEDAIDFAKDLGKFIEANRRTLDDILQVIDNITRDTVGLITDFFTLQTSANTWKSILETIKDSMQIISGILRTIRLTQEALYRATSALSGLIGGDLTSSMNAFLDTALPGLREIINLFRQIGALSGRSNPGAGVGNALQTGVDQLAGKTDYSYKGNKTAGKGDKGAKNKAAQIADAQNDYERADIEQAKNLYLANLKVQENALEESYRLRLKSTDEYYAELSLIQRREIGGEIAAQKELLKVAQANLARQKEQADIIRAKAEILAIEGRIETLQVEQAEKGNEVNRQKAKRIEELTAEYNELRNVLNEFEGLGLEANIARINDKYKEQIERATADGRQDIVDLIEQIKKYEKTLVKLADTEKGYNSILARRDDELEKINELLERGAIDELEAGNRRIKIEREYKGELLDSIEAMIILAQRAKDFDRATALQATKRRIQNSGEFTTSELLQRERSKFDQLREAMSLSNRALDNQVAAGSITPELAAVRRLEIEQRLKGALQESVNKMRELAAATATLDDDLAVESLALEIENLGQKTSTLKTGIIDGLRSGLGGFFSDIISGTKSVGDAFLSMISSILSSIAQLAANELIRSLFASKAINGGANGGGLSGFLSSGIGWLSKIFGGGFAEGGSIRGSGTATSDSIPIMASNGEFMIKAATVRKLGVPFLNMLNAGNFAGIFGRFAEGGAIGTSPIVSTGGTTVNTKNRIVNVLDPNLVRDAMSSSDGEEIFLNFIGKNSKKISQLLG